MAKWTNLNGRNVVRLFAVFMTFLYLAGVYILMLGSSIDHSNILDWEVRIGQFLYKENSSSFDFVAFREYTKLIGNFDFKVKLYPETFNLINDLTTNKYFTRVSSKLNCFTEGTDIDKSIKSKKCKCKMMNQTSQKYFGKDCGIPLQIWLSSGSNDVERQSRIWTLRARPRNLIYAVPLNHEFDMFETRMSLNYEVVDVFIVGESNRTNSGGIKTPHFLLRFASGWLKKYQDKILYVFQGTFPKEGYEDGVIADAYMRRHITRNGFQRLSGFRADDLFIYTDGDELIRTEILQFMKLYDGYTEPIAFQYKWSIFGFFWTVQEDLFGQHKTPEPGGMSVQFFRDFYKLDASHVRTRDYEIMHTMIADYQSRNGSVKMWDILDAGWHCSWCFKPEGIRKKLLDAPKSDYPRYGDDVAKTQLDYIKRLIKHGLYFDLDVIRRNGSELTVDQDPDMAPKFVLENFSRMGYLLKNPYKNFTIPRFQ